MGPLFGYYIAATTMSPPLASFRVSDVSRIEVLLGDGKDVAVIGPFVDVPATLDGGDGNRFLTASNVTNDLALDRLTGSGGQDWYWAVAGQDEVVGKASNEALN